VSTASIDRIAQAVAVEALSGDLTRLSKIAGDLRHQMSKAVQMYRNRGLTPGVAAALKACEEGRRHYEGACQTLREDFASRSAHCPSLPRVRWPSEPARQAAEQLAGPV